MNAGKIYRPSEKKSKIISLVRQRCPRCHEGGLFISSNPYNFKDGTKMHGSCLLCNQDFKIEPGFYIGALWTSFPIVVLIMAFLSILLLGYIGLSLHYFFIFLTLSLFLLQPVITRLGRSIWIHIFVKYDPEATASFVHKSK